MKWRVYKNSAPYRVWPCVFDDFAEACALARRLARESGKMYCVRRAR